MANRHRGGAYKDFVKDGRWTGRVELIPDQLRKVPRGRPRRVATCLMGDLFHESLPDEAIDQVVGVMAWESKNTYQLLTKRSKRLRDYSTGLAALSRENRGRRIVRSCGYSVPASNTAGGMDWPLPNVWLGVSVEDQATADERIPLLLQTPAAVRWVSYEPALAGVDWRRWLRISWQCSYCQEFFQGAWQGKCPGCGNLGGWSGSHKFNPPGRQIGSGLDWLVIGGESGPGARPCNVEWIRDVVRQCREAGVPVFVKQLGARPFAPEPVAGVGQRTECREPGVFDFYMKHPKGGTMDEWPEDLRIREFPNGVR